MNQEPTVLYPFEAIQWVYMRIRSCIGVSHKFLRERTKLLEIALVCIKKPLRKNSHFAALMKKMVAGEQKNEVPYFVPSMKAFGYM